MEIPFWTTSSLFFFVFFAGFIDSAAGGGGLISLPAYLFTGMPVHTAIGCNKFSASCGTTLSALLFFRHGALDWKIAAISAFFSFAASLFGMKLALKISPNTLKNIFMFVLPIIALPLVFQKDFGRKNDKSKLSRIRAVILAAVTGLSVGFYDGLIGPGTGTIAIMAYSGLMKYDLKTASGNAKILNLASNYASLITVILNHKVIYSIAVPAAIFGILGNYAGTFAALKKGQVFIRFLMLAVMGFLFAKLLYTSFYGM